MNLVPDAAGPDVVAPNGKSGRDQAIEWIGAGEIFRLCLDLNVFCADFLSVQQGSENTACQALVEVARKGRCALGLTQLVVSWGMLTRLRKVLEENLGVVRPEADSQLRTIASYARLGPSGHAPYVLLGGTRMMPLRDDEDVHVLDTAIAGDAHVLATANFRDFISYRTEILKPERIAIHHGPKRPLIIAHPFEVVRWTREGRISFT
jgi:hypothetical protein